MKKIFRYVILLIVAYIIVEVLVYFLTKTYYKDLNNYDILVESPVIEITESKVAKSKGYIQGNITNDTGELMRNLRVKFDFYNEQGKYVGSENKTIDVFNISERLNFDIKYEYKDVSEIKISIVREE